MSFNSHFGPFYKIIYYRNSCSRCDSRSPLKVTYGQGNKEGKDCRILNKTGGAVLVFSLHIQESINSFVTAELLVFVELTQFADDPRRQVGGIGYKGPLLTTTIMPTTPSSSAYCDLQYNIVV